MINNIGKARHMYSMRIGEEITQDRAAAMFGVSPSGYKKWEQGFTRLNGNLLCKIADTYGCSVDYLLCLVDDPGETRTEYAAIDLDDARFETVRRCWQEMGDADRDVLVRVATSLVDGEQR